MGRKEQKVARDMSQEAFNTQTAYTKEDRAVRSKGRELVQPKAEGLATSQGYSPEEQAALIAETTGVASSAYGKASDQLTRRAARTHNTAGLAGSRAEMARTEAQGQASTARQNRLAMADEKQRRNEQGINLLARLYDVDTGAFTAGRGGANASLENYTNLANQKGFGDKMQNVAAAWMMPHG